MRHLTIAVCLAAFIGCGLVVQTQSSGGAFDPTRDYSVTGQWTFTKPPVGTSGGGGTPGGSDTQVQFNDGGSFGGNAGFTFTKSNGTLTIPGDIPRPPVDPDALVNIGLNPLTGHESNSQKGLNVDFYSQATSPTGLNVNLAIVRRAPTTGFAIGLYTQVDNESFVDAGVIPKMRGIWADRNTDSGFGVTDNDGIYIDNQGGQAVNNYALHIADQGTGATDYAIKVEGGQSVFGGPIISGGSGVAVANVGANSCGTTTATISGNDNAGTITIGATAGTQCRVTFTTTAATRRECTVTDETTTIATRATYVDATNTDFLGAFGAGDLVSYVCFAR